MRALAILLLLALAGCFEPDFAQFTCQRGGSAPANARAFTRADAQAIDASLPATLDRLVAEGNATFRLSGAQGERLRGFALPNATGVDGLPWVFDYEGTILSCRMLVP